MITNKVDIKYNMQALDRDFDVYLLEKQGYTKSEIEEDFGGKVPKNINFNKSLIPDLPTNEYHALSVVYSSGAKCFVLFEKEEQEQQRFLDLVEETDDCRVRKIDLLNEEECNAVFFGHGGKLLLGQLLFNSMKAPKNAAFQYNNLTGKLYYFKPEWTKKDKQHPSRKSCIWGLEIKLESGMHLSLHVKTFRRTENVYKGPKYIFDKRTGIFRRKLKSDQNVTDLYEIRAYKDNHNVVKFLDFYDYDLWSRCRLGILDAFLQEVEEKLGQYIKVTLIERDDYNELELTDDEKKALTTEAINKIHEKGIQIVDAVKDEESTEFMNLLSETINTYYGICATVGEVVNEKYNLRIIHNEKYYDNREDTKDPHQDNFPGCIVQHVTIEDFKKQIVEKKKDKKKDSKEPAALRKVMHELVIKADLIPNVITGVDWQQYGFGDTWTFISCKNNELERGKERSHTFFVMKIKTNGCFEKYTFSDAEILLDEEQSKIAAAYEVFYQKKGKDNAIDGLVYSDIENIHCIVRTNEFTMPDIRRLGEGLKLTDDRDEINRDEILEYLGLFQQEVPEEEEYISETMLLLQKLPAVTNKKKIRTAINMKGGAGKRFNRFMHQNFGLWISAEVKNKDFEEDYKLENVLNIKYSMGESFPGANDEIVNYFVGDKREGLKTSLQNACIVRTIRSMKNEIEFETLMKLMAVEFVREERYTVLPFPFKYLKEYQNMMGCN